MGKKIFVSYKYGDRNVKPLQGSLLGMATARNYVDELERIFAETNHIYKGENDGLDLSQFKDSTIGSRLADKIYDSTVTIVLISAGMVDRFKPQEDQWIPWEIAYSLREQTRDGRVSKSNALLGVVIPDRMGSYSHFIQPGLVPNSTTFVLANTFKIIRENFFNRKEPETSIVNGRTVYHGQHSYMHVVKWEDFVSNFDLHIESALENWRIRDQFEIRKSV